MIRPFAFAMLVGVLVGTYSSIYIAAPVLLLLHQRFGAGGPASPAVAGAEGLSFPIEDVTPPSRPPKQRGVSRRKGKKKRR